MYRSELWTMLSGSLKSESLLAIASENIVPDNFASQHVTNSIDV
jgi:hypothetical protein